MPDSWVLVAGPPDQDVYTNGNTVDPAGRTNDPFEVEIGAQTFQLLDLGTRPPTVLAQTDATITAHPKDRPQKVELWPAGTKPGAAAPAARSTGPASGGKP